MSTNKNSAKTAFGRIVLAAALTALPILTACGGNQEQGSQVQTVEVHLKDGAIQMPASLPSGPTTFEVVNEGNQALSLEIEGPAGQKVPSIQPGQTASVDMNLDPGTYRVHAPENQAMVVALNVTQS
jgi:hypothetical protein